MNSTYKKMFMATKFGRIAIIRSESEEKYDCNIPCSTFFCHGSLFHIINSAHPADSSLYYARE